MAESKEIKFTDDELKSLQEVQQGYQDMQVKMGGLKMQQIAHERNADRLAELEEALMTELQELNEKETGTAQELNDKYGPGSLNPETGVFTPQEAPEETPEA
tara:strand:+ start:1221 stop:1526 length:306 start_codon:yes stop_codon:yes gene_type:complete